MRATQSSEWQHLVSNEEAFGMKIYTLLNNNNNGYYDHSSNHDPIIASKYQSNVFIKKHRLTGVWDLALQMATRGQSICKLSKRLWYHNVPLPCYSSFADNDIRCNATAQVVTSVFFTQGIVIGRGASVDVNVIEQEQVNGRLFPITSDKNVSTCVNTTLGHDQLQAIFTFPALPPSDQLSVEVILMIVNDCSSPAWTSFVESECRPKTTLNVPAHTLLEWQSSHAVQLTVFVWIRATFCISNIIGFQCESRRRSNCARYGRPGMERIN